MNSWKIYKFIGRWSRWVFVHFPALYFLFYSCYKRLSDSFKHELFRQFVRPGANAIDVGAHIGYYSRLFAKLVGNRGRVLAFEASLENFGYLRKNTAKFGMIKCYNTAISNANGQALLYISPYLDVDHRIYNSRSEPRESMPIKQIRLDDLLRDVSQKISFIKIDIQGSEYKALEGMKKLLERDRPVILTEFWPWGLKQAGDSGEAMLDFLKALGYSILLIDEKNKTCREFSLDELDNAEDKYYDLLCQSA